MALQFPTCKLRSWKQHTCCACGCVYRYQMERTSQATMIASAEELAKRKLETQCDIHPCPTCGLIQPEMAAQSPILWHGAIVGVSALAFVVLICVGSVPEFNCTPIATLVGAGLAGLVAMAHLIVTLRNPNRNRKANRERAESAVASGVVEVVRPGSLDNLASAPHSSLACRALAVVAAAGAVLVFLNQHEVMEHFQPLANPDLKLPLIVPGDTPQFSFNTEMKSIHGHWRGDPKAILLNAGQLGLDPKLKATGRSDEWADKLSAKIYEVDSPWTPYATVTIPKLSALEGKTLLVRVTMPVVYPAKTGEKTYRDQETTLVKDLSIQVGFSGVIRAYWTAWGLAVGVGSFGSMASGFALYMLGMILRSRGNAVLQEPTICA